MLLEAPLIIGMQGKKEAPREKEKNPES